MTDDSCNIPNELQPYLSTDDVYRAILYQDWLIQGGSKVKHQAFYRRTKDTNGVSVNPTPEDCRRHLRLAICGIVQLNVGQVREIRRKDGIQLEIIPETPTHGNIKRLPFRDEDRIEATRLAKLLAEKAQVYIDT